MNRKPTSKPKFWTRKDVAAESPQLISAPNLQQLRSKLQSVLVERKLAAIDYETLSKRIASSVLQQSQAIDQPNFSSVRVSDLRLMAEAYDELFFDSSCIALAKHYGMSFRWSSRMTRAGGKTTRTVHYHRPFRKEEVHYEIALSSSLLFQTFQKQDHTVRVCGRPCLDRLTAMQRIVEHEMIHLGEMLVWVDSDCAAGRFQSIANRLFGHTEHRHELMTQRERAAKQFNVRVGSRVQFEFEGRQLTGIVNRITRRATILVESPQGELYNNDKRYLKYYVPIQALRAMQ